MLKPCIKRSDDSTSCLPFVDHAFVNLIIDIHEKGSLPYSADLRLMSMPGEPQTYCVEM